MEAIQKAHEILKDGNDERQDIIRVQQAILEKVQKRDGTPTKFLNLHEDAVNLVAVDISQIILGMFDSDDCKLVTLGDPSVPSVNRRGIFGLFQEPRPEYPAHIQSLAQAYSHISEKPCMVSCFSSGDPKPNCSIAPSSDSSLGNPR